MPNGPKQKSPGLRGLTRSSLLPLAAITLAATIFVVDTLTDLEIAVAVFYTAVVLMSVGFSSRRGVALVGLGCIGLTVLSNFLTPQVASPAAVINTAISALAIVSTTYLAIKIDAAERVASEARAQLAHAGRVTALGELAGSLAHEVNQPIAATVANASAALRWLSNVPPDLAEATTALERIVKDASRAGSIVSRIRGLAKRAPAAKEPCDVNDIILEITGLMSGELRKRGTVLVTELQAGLPKINADAIQLQQVVLNLVMNALESMDAVPASKRSLILTSSYDPSGNITATIRDSGAGFKDAAEAERIFTAFYSTKSSGLGLGLAIARSIVESHGGRIWAEQGVSHGAEFRFTLPVLPAVS